MLGTLAMLAKKEDDDGNTKICSKDDGVVTQQKIKQEK